MIIRQVPDPTARPDLPNDWSGLAYCQGARFWRACPGGFRAFQPYRGLKLCRTCYPHRAAIWKVAQAKKGRT